MERKRVQCYFDIEIEHENVGRIVFSLWKDLVPKTAENFRALCTGEKGTSKSGNKLCYQGSIIHRVVKNFMVQGGDFTKFNGTGGESIYGGRFEDEILTFKHSRAGLLSMANAGPNTNGSQFFITCAPASHLDGLHVIFGEVAQGMQVLRRIENEPTIVSNNYRPERTIRISACGELSEDEYVPFENFENQKKKHSPPSSPDSSRTRFSQDDQERNGRSLRFRDNLSELPTRIRIDSKGRVVKGRGNIGRGSQCALPGTDRRRNGYRERVRYRGRAYSRENHYHSSPNRSDSLSPPHGPKKRRSYSNRSPEFLSDRTDTQTSATVSRDSGYRGELSERVSLRNPRQLISYDIEPSPESAQFYSDAAESCSQRRTSRSPSPSRRSEDSDE
ncbi:uncharacterized protein LOC126323263 [Schistocerca gregaria]|uniref:uncharacterized protein LOC126323263 n=1 Tax=Schistocerca gregaria TaxID=7010 RepID=UPI00211EBB1D|nr:uncharacterized protein LOC126323263 [Schistocerca gregaria]